MKNFIIFVLLALAAVGCGVSYMLLRLPQHDVTALIVKYLGAKPGEESAAGAPAADAGAASSEESVAAGAADEGARPDEVAEEKPAAKDPDEGKEWRGLSDENWYAGKKLTEDDFKGKVTMVYVWSSKQKPSVEMLSRIQSIWASFKHKPLVLVGSHRGGRNPKIPNAYKKLGLTFPMYDDVSFARESAVSSYPYIYIVNHHGRFAYRGASERSATEALVEALTACELKQ